MFGVTRLSLSLAVCIACFAPWSAFAQSDQELEQARTWFQEGDQAEAAGDCAGAIAKFSQALAVKETAQLHLRIGRCQDKLGKLKDALASFEKGLALAGGEAALVELATKMRNDADARVPRLTIKAQADAKILLDGAPVAQRGQATTVDPGTHVVEGEAPGMKPFKQEIQIDAGDRRDFVVNFQPAELVEPRPPPTEPPKLTPYPFIVLGVGAAMLGASIGLGVSGDQTLQDADEEGAKLGCRVGDDAEQEAFGAVRICPGERTAAHDEYFDMIDSANLQFGLSMGFGVGAGAALVVGGVLLGLDLGSSPEPEASPAVSFSPWAGPRGGGIAVGKRF